MDRSSLIAAMQSTATRLGKARVTQAEFRREAGVTRHMVARHFSTHCALAEAAGQPAWRGQRRTPGGELLRSLRDVFIAEGPGVSLKRAIRRSGRFPSTFLNRWGSWRGVIAAFVAWAEQEEPAFPHLEALRRRLPQRPPEGLRADSRRFGELLRFRTLEYAPTEESGVIYLFALLSADLGFIVDGLSKAFPDAEAKRQVGEEWRRVRIEFEYESRNFRRHGHDPAGCDLIVCWAHNWPDCPLEVLELRREIGKLRARADDGEAYVAFCGEGSSTQPLMRHSPPGKRAIS